MSLTMDSTRSALECELMDCKARIHILSAKIGNIEGNVEFAVQDEIEKLREKERTICEKIHHIAIKRGKAKERFWKF